MKTRMFAMAMVFMLFLGINFVWANEETIETTANILEEMESFNVDTFDELLEVLNITEDEVPEINNSESEGADNLIFYKADNFDGSIIKGVGDSYQLVITELTILYPSHLDVGDTVTFRYIIGNTGYSASPSGLPLRIYVSGDGDLDLSDDTRIKNVTVGSVPAGGTIPYNVSATVSGGEGCDKYIYFSWYLDDYVYVTNQRWYLYCTSSPLPPTPPDDDDDDDSSCFIGTVNNG